MNVRLTRWAIFTVVFSLVPFVVVLMALWIDSKPLTWDLWPHGELLLVAVAIAADAVGDLIGSSSKAGAAKVLSGGSAIILLFAGAVWYAMVQIRAYQPDRIWWADVYIFVLAVVTSFFCKRLAEDQ